MRARAHTHTIRSLGTDMQRMEAEVEQNKDHKFLGGRKKSFPCSHFNPSAWSDERCSSWRKHHLSWSDEHCLSCCTLSLIRLYLDNIGRKCNRAALYVFMKELALLWCGRQFLQIIASFFLSRSSGGFLFAVPNFTGGFMGLWNEEMKYETNVIAIIT